MDEDNDITDNWVKTGTGYRPDDCPYQTYIITCEECEQSWKDDDDCRCTCDDE